MPERRRAIRAASTTTTPTALKDDTANMYTIAWKHHFDKNVYCVSSTRRTPSTAVTRTTTSGAGGRGVTTDCHDGTTYSFVTDYSSAGPDHLGRLPHAIGFSTGV